MTTATTRTALVLDADQPYAPCVVRSLGRHGVCVHVASAEPKPIASRSRHAKRCFRYADPLVDGEAFIADVERLCRDGGYDLVIPLTERSLPLLAAERDRFADHTRLAIASDEALAKVLDKRATLELAAELGVPVPRSERIADSDALAAVAERIDYPAVLKPASSIPLGQDDSARTKLNVSYAFSADELLKTGAEVLRYCPLLVQQYAKGDGIGVEVMARDGEIVYAFQHRRLHEVPLTGGGSSLRISEDVHPDLLGYSQRLLKAIGWDGCAMVEFKLDRARNQARLMEINGRFWGSLPLAVAAGADFPVLLFEHFVHGRIPDLPPARPGVLSRKLGADLAWHEAVLRRMDDPRLVQYPSKGEIARGLLGVFSFKHHFDLQKFDDPMPGLVDLGQIAGYHTGRVTDILATKARRLAAANAVQRRRLAKRARGARRVLFLCFGNINRSAVAHRYAEQQQAPFESISAGFYQRAGRPCDPNMVAAAKAGGLDMQVWSSSPLTEAMTYDADLILVMEVEQLRRLHAEYPHTRGKAFLLALANEQSRGAEIPDPYGHAAEHYAACFESVTAAVSGLILAARL